MSRPSMMRPQWLLLVLLFIVGESSLLLAKHHAHKYSCPVLRRCPTHRHKVCGSDGKLYNSLCNLRKAACETDLTLRAVHPEHCEEETDGAGDSRPGSSSQHHQQSAKTSNGECNPQRYDQMKEALLLKTSDVSLLFTALDENSDGSININELWRKSATFRTGNSPCLITDLLQHEDRNQDDFLDFTEFQSAFSNLYTVTMVTLDQNLAVNTIQAHIGSNVEIRCDITGRPQMPVIKWLRFGVDLASLNIPNMKVFSDGSLFLTDVQLSFSGNFTCLAESNPSIKQVHILHVNVMPRVQVRPSFQWQPTNGLASIDCQYDVESENVGDEVRVSWMKNDQPVLASQRTTIMNNGSRIQIGQLTRSDTGAYSCRVENRRDGAVGQSVASLLVQDEQVGASVSEDRSQRKRLWVFHANGISIYNQEGCNGLLHEIDGRDILPQNGLALCSTAGSNEKATAADDDDADDHLCQWASPLLVDGRVYVAQPNQNRVLVINERQLNVVQIVQVDPEPREMWLVRNKKEARVWVLCHGLPLNSNDNGDGGSRKKQKDIKRGKDFGFGNFEFEESAGGENFEFEWNNSPQHEQQRQNRKTVQIIRISENVSHQNVIHLQPIDGHFDLVYDLFVPTPSSIHTDHFHYNNRYAYVTHFDERSLVKIDMEQFKYIKTIALLECQPVSALFTEFGLIILQCQTPVTHQLNGQLLVDQLTDAIIAYNPHVKAHRAYISPNQHFLVNILHNSTRDGLNTTTIIVQRVTRDGVQFMYDVRTTLNIVNCEFVWKNGNYDAVLASGTPNREDLLYLSLIDGRVELISGIGRPTEGFRRAMAISADERIGAVTSRESVFIVDLASNRVQCETQHRHREPSALLWT